MVRDSESLSSYSHVSEQVRQGSNDPQAATCSTRQPALYTRCNGEFNLNKGTTPSRSNGLPWEDMWKLYPTWCTRLRNLLVIGTTPLSAIQDYMWSHGGETIHGVGICLKTKSDSLLNSWKRIRVVAWFKEYRSRVQVDIRKRKMVQLGCGRYLIGHLWKAQISTAIYIVEQHLLYHRRWCCSQDVDQCGPLKTLYHILKNTTTKIVVHSIFGIFNRFH